jgi:iron(III) transport system substrate-binding protein
VSETQRLRAQGRRRPWAQSVLAVASVLALGAALTACGDDSSATSSTDATSAAALMAQQCGGTQSDWQTLIEGAQKEGQVTVAGPPNPDVNSQVPAAFKSRFGISVNYIAGSSGETAQKIQSERAANVYSLDDFLAGGNTMSTVIYGGKWLQDLKSQLVSPQLAQAATWQGAGDHAPFVDQPNYNSVAKLSIQGQEQILINTDMVGDSIKGWKDLLDPKWKGKIVAMDPTTGSGLGFNVAVMLYSKLGPSFINQLYKGQGVVLQTDDRQAADAVAKGQDAVAIGVSEANGQIDQMIDDGLPVKVISMPDDAPAMVSAGYGELGLMEHPAHPNAAKLFANWLMCPDGNEAWNKANRYQSTRTDVSIDVPDFIKADLTKPYWDTYDWKLLTSDTTKQVLNYLNTNLK